MGYVEQQRFTTVQFALFRERSIIDEGYCGGGWVGYRRPGMRPGRLFIFDFLRTPRGINTLDLFQSPGLIFASLGTVHVRAI